MSGGSFDYLCSKDIEELLANPWQLEDMYQAIAKLGYAPDAARETEELRLTLLAAKTRFDVVLERMRPIWKAMEWWQSCDWGEDDFKEALAEYRKRQ